MIRVCGGRRVNRGETELTKYRRVMMPELLMYLLRNLSDFSAAWSLPEYSEGVNFAPRLTPFSNQTTKQKALITGLSVLGYYNVIYNQHPDLL
jgi:hypothetical protein